MLSLFLHKSDIGFFESKKLNGDLMLSQVSCLHTF